MRSCEEVTMRTPACSPALLFWIRSIPITRLFTRIACLACVGSLRRVQMPSPSSAGIVGVGDECNAEDNDSEQQEQQEGAGRRAHLSCASITESSDPSRILHAFSVQSYEEE